MILFIHRYRVDSDSTDSCYSPRLLNVLICYVVFSDAGSSHQNDLKLKNSFLLFAWSKSSKKSRLTKKSQKIYTVSPWLCELVWVILFIHRYRLDSDSTDSCYSPRLLNGLICYVVFSDAGWEYFTMTVAKTEWSYEAAREDWTNAMPCSLCGAIVCSWTFVSFLFKRKEKEKIKKILSPFCLIKK